MTVQTLTRRTDYIADGVQTVYAYDYYMLDVAHMEVYFDGVFQPTGYTVDGIGNPTGGNVTFLVAPAAGVELVLLRNVPLTQEIDYTEYDSFPAETHEAGLDLGIMVDQQLAEFDARAVHYGIGDSPPGGTTLPAPEPLKAIGYDNDGNLANVAVGIGGTPVVNPLQEDLLSGGTYGFVVTDVALQELGRFDHTGLNVPNQIQINGVDIGTLYADKPTANAHYGNLDIHYSDAIADGVPRVRLDNDWVDLDTALGIIGAGTGALPVGGLLEFTGSLADLPDGFLNCDGSAVSRTVYDELNALYEAAGYPFGDGDGSTTFNLPPFSGRTAVGVGQGNTGEGGSPGATYALGDQVGADVHRLTQSEMPQHRHDYTYNNASQPQGFSGGNSINVIAGTPQTGLAGGDQPHENRQASLAVYILVRYTSQDTGGGQVPDLLTTLGDLLTHSGVAYQRLARGLNGQVLKVGPTGALIWADETGGVGGAVDSVFGRTGAVVAQANDYTSSQVQDLSAVPGTTVTQALNNLNASKADAGIDVLDSTAQLLTWAGGNYLAFSPGADNTYLRITRPGGTPTLSWAPITLNPGSVGNPQLSDMPANSIKLRPATLGQPQDLRVDQLTDGGAPAGVDYLLGQKDSGDLVHFRVGQLPGGPGGGIDPVPETKTITIPGTFSNSTFVVPFYIGINPGIFCKLIEVIVLLDSGAFTNAKLQRNGVDIGGLTTISVTAGVEQIIAPTTGGGEPVNNRDRFNLVWTDTFGGAADLSFACVFHHTSTP